MSIHSVEHWRQESLPQSRVVFEELRRDLENKIPNSPSQAESRMLAPAESTRRINMYFNMLVPLINIHIRAATKFWLDYTIGDILFYGQTDSLTRNTHSERGQAGLRIGSQSIAFVAVSDGQQQLENTLFGNESIRLPTFHSLVELSNKQLNVLASLERISISLTADVLDSVLAVQSRFEHDIDELLSVLAKRKARKAGSAGAVNLESEMFREIGTPWKAQVALRGINLSLKGPLATQSIGADLVGVYVQQDIGDEGKTTFWDVKASNLALSLAQRTGYASPSLSILGEAAKFDRNYRLAYFVLDVEAGNTVSEVSELPSLVDNKEASHLHINLAKLHAVMQTAAIEALDDLIEHCKFLFYTYVLGVYLIMYSDSHD